MDQKVEKVVPVPIYTNRMEGAKGGAKFRMGEFFNSEIVTIILDPVADELPKDAKPGDWIYNNSKVIDF